MKPADYLAIIPKNPLCGEKGNAKYLPAEEAISYPLVAPHINCMRQVMAFDLDYPHSWFLPEERGLPEPSFIAVSKGTGRAHAGYFLETPVSFFDKSREGPIQFYKDVEIGFRNRLTSDPLYNGLLVKNPFHLNHVTDWQAVRPYRLDELRDSLDRDDIKKARIKVLDSGMGRNVTVFDTIRQIAYREVRKLKKSGKTMDDLLEIMILAAMDVNAGFDFKLSYNELRCTARSVSRWVWPRFTLSRFSEIQTMRAVSRWAKSGSLTVSKPWEADGISRRTWERRRSAESAIPDMVLRQAPLRENGIILPEN